MRYHWFALQAKQRFFLPKNRLKKIELVTRPVAYQPKAIERIVVKSLSYGNELMPSQQRAVVDAFHKFTLFWHLSRDLSSKKSVAATGRSVLSRSVSYLHPAPSSHFSHLLFTGNATELYYQLTCILGALFWWHVWYCTWIKKMVWSLETNSG